MSLLSDLPDDILGLISFWLNGFDNCFLWMASDSKLKQRLINNVITDFDIKYRIPGRYLWPGNFLKRLQRLSRLSLVVADDVYHLPIENIEFFPIETLKHLKISCHNHEFTSLISSSSSSLPKHNLAINFPNLEHLYVKGGYEFLSFHFLHHLPPNLKTLSNHLYFQVELIGSTSMNTSDDLQLLNKHIEALPRGLTDLILYFDDLNLDHMNDLDFSKFPPNLTSLTTNAPINQNVFDKIPKRLKVLKSHRSRVNMKKMSPFLPAQLETLSICLDSTESSVDDHLSHLQYLEHLEVIAHQTKSATITKWPPNLKSFRGISIDFKGIETFSFPKNLTKLYLDTIKGATSEFVASLPQTLTYLSLFCVDSDETFKFFEMLPKHLESLDTNLSVIENTSTLPKSLKRLYLLMSGTYRFDILYLDRLPPKLETLIVYGVYGPSEVLTVELPETLQEIILTGNFITDDALIGRLPRGLKSLTFKTNDNITDASAGLFPPNLTFLSLEKNTKMTDHAISKLPRSLTHLALQENTNFTDACVKSLPRLLVKIMFDGVTKISSRYCKDLPRYLRVLRLPKCTDWKEEAVKDLPIFLHSFLIGSQGAVKKAWHERKRMI